ncbi:DUF2799 domain-containing protein [Vibrio rumoiensis]|uniref:DUF2799 domain-containing protein n=1 Tax=Vibrio rumoiensis 1S-45 TaxID=1188252 RepID=A0A1E5DZ35_9VIBR|nr:DUF2799 domain-containing protein [Vibrio rumoiensis]OEF22994.1 hypothetical protein A1QC_13030 [Vibrio rumoiensis 1S-45]
MKRIFFLLTIFIIAGCASQNDFPDSANTQAWQVYGQERAEKGFVEHTKQDLIKQSGLGTLNDEAIKAYRQGYLIGQKQYCSQNASWLGSTGQAYRGICDNIDPFFRQDYMSGVQSHADSL